MKSILIFLLSIMPHIVFLQEKNIDIEGIVVKRIPKVETIIERLQKQLKKNCDTIFSNYLLRQYSLKNEDTVINRNEVQKIKIQNLLGSFQRKNIVENYNNWFTKFKSFFLNYDEKEIPIGWISGFPVRLNLSVSSLDFFVNQKQYVYTSSRNIDDQIEVEFTSRDYLKGKFIVDEKYNIVSIVYSIMQPYPFYHKSVNNLGLQFSSNWMYTKKNIVIQFQLINNKIKLKSLEIDEMLKDFVFKRFNSNNLVLFEEKNNFKTYISIKNEN